MPFEAPYEVVKTMRAAICVLGPLLAKKHKARVSLPGGCAIGPRPVDLHIKGLKALGATIEIDHGYINATAEELIGTEIVMAGKWGSTVLGTDNVMSAATLAKGTTIIEAAAMEPETEDMANFLISMGAKIKGAGTSRLEITGVDQLHGTRYKIIPDRIETGTFMTMVSATGGKLTLHGVNPNNCQSTIDALQQMNVQFHPITDNTLEVEADSNLKGISIETRPYPGFPTDMQSQISTVMAIAEGQSIITEHIYPDRFNHIQELLRMGASIDFELPTIIIHGGSKLEGAQVMASDLRGGAALVIAGLAAQNTTQLRRIYHIDRGYEDLEQKIQNVGGNIERVRTTGY
jgi:UDP-N-acetylglucosamine 1-carboxyvinyltransferase